MVSTLSRTRRTAACLLATTVLLAGLAALATAAEAADSAAPAAYPLQLSTNHRYLVDQNGAPFLMVGDSPQALIGNLSEADADAFFANRQAAGFNTQWINLLCNNYTACRPDGSTYDGLAPFTTPGDLSKPNEAYFSKVERVLQLAAKHGQVVLLDPIETGGWTGVATGNGPTKTYAYGKYLGQRFKSFPNIIWMSGNDFQSWRTTSDDAAIRAVAQGIKDSDPNHLQTIELDYQRSGSLDDASWGPLLGLDAAYTYFPTYDQVLREYNRATIPVFMVEANYEGEHNAGDQGTAQILRRQEYWTLLSGATGQLFGNRYTWQFIDGWKSNLDTAASNQMQYVTKLFSSRQWYNLVPDQNHTVVTGGYGTYSKDGSVGGNDYLTAARTPDGSLAIAYMPTLRNVTVDLTSFGGTVNASWYDPSRGTYLRVAGSPFANSGPRDFSPPGNNADGDGDWLLVLEAAGNPALADLSPPVPAPAQVPTPSSNPAPATAPAPTPVPADVPAPAALAPTSTHFVQVNNAVPQSPESTVSVSYSQPQAAGNMNLLAIGWNDSTSTIVSVSDSAGNAYQVAAPTARGEGVSQAIYYAANINGGANNVTVVFSGPVPYADIRIAEYAGLDKTGPFDTSASAAGSDANASSGTVTTGTANELIVGVGITTGGFSGPGTQFMVRTITSPDADILEDWTASSTGSFAATAPGNGSWVMQVATFR